VKRILSEAEYERLRKTYNGQSITCTKCGKLGLLQFRLNQGGRRYFYCKHGDKSCYIARIEDIQKAMHQPKITPPKTGGRQVSFGVIT
jgi:hypothetical protein